MASHSPRAAREAPALLPDSHLDARGADRPFCTSLRPGKARVFRSNVFVDELRIALDDGGSLNECADAVVVLWEWLEDRARARHEFVAFHLRCRAHGGHFWARYDRNADLRPRLALFATLASSAAGSSGDWQLGHDRDYIVGRDDTSPIASIDYDSATAAAPGPSLRECHALFAAVNAQSPQYSLYAYNCWWVARSATAIMHHHRAFAHGSVFMPKRRHFPGRRAQLWCLWAITVPYLAVVVGSLTLMVRHIISIRQYLAIYVPTSLVTAISIIWMVAIGAITPSMTDGAGMPSDGCEISPLDVRLASSTRPATGATATLLLFPLIVASSVYQSVLVYFGGHLRWVLGAYAAHLALALVLNALWRLPLRASAADAFHWDRLWELRALATATRDWQGTMERDDKAASVAPCSSIESCQLWQPLLAADSMSDVRLILQKVNALCRSNRDSYCRACRWGLPHLVEGHDGGLVPGVLPLEYVRLQAIRPRGLDGGGMPERRCCLFATFMALPPFAAHAFNTQTIAYWCVLDPLIIALYLPVVWAFVRWGT